MHKPEMTIFFIDVMLYTINERYRNRACKMGLKMEWLLVEAIAIPLYCEQNGIDHHIHMYR